MSFLGTTLNTILNVVFPAYCVSCGKSGIDLCSSCLMDFREAERESAKWIFPIYDYRHPPLKKSLWLFKYKGKRRFARVFAEMLYGRILEELSELSLMENFREPILIPIPLSKGRYRERGYNQTELICEELIKIDQRHLGYSVDIKSTLPNFILGKNILIKINDIKHQAHIENRRERIRNVIGSFAIQKENEIILKNRNIILIDDITTTGATLSEARKILKQAGAKKIIAFTVAH